MSSLVEGQSTFVEERALATARLASADHVRKHDFKSGKFWIGRAPDADETPIGHTDDRHICLVSGSRGGKGTSVIVNNLAEWPGSIVVVDPKGENASILARRRGYGSDYADGMQQNTYVFDPFKASNVPDDLRATFNPLDALNPESDECVDEAGRIADAIVVAQNQNDPFWDEQARTLIKGLILHVLTFYDFEDRRNLVTVRQLLTSGDAKRRRTLEELGEEDIPSAFALLFEGMRHNTAFNGVISGAGEIFRTMFLTSKETFNGVLSAAANHTEFIDSIPMQRALQSTTPGFSLARLKRDPMGVSIFLSLPQRFMNTHFRWLRMIVTLVLTEMEKEAGQPSSGHPILLCLDEFAGLKKLEIVEHAAAQIAGYGVKMFFVLQTLAQLKAVYGEGWETFLANAGLKMFFGVEDAFTREYLSKYIGETEVVRVSTNQSQTTGSSVSMTRTSTHGSSSSSSYTSGTSTNISFNGNVAAGGLWTNARQSSGGGVSISEGFSSSSTSSNSTSTSESLAMTEGRNESQTEGATRTIQKRALFTPDEIGQCFARIDDKDHVAYPGLAIALLPGHDPVIARRSNYFDDRHFVRKFDPHPDHGFKALPPLVPAQPLPPPAPSMRSQLEKKFGASHVAKAHAIFDKIAHDYPHLQILSVNRDQLVRDLIESCVNSIESAARHNRAHTMTETLDIAENHLGKLLITENWSQWRGMQITYGDENRPVAGLTEEQKKNLKIIGIGIFIVWVIIMIASS